MPLRKSNKKILLLLFHVKCVDICTPVQYFDGPKYIKNVLKKMSLKIL